jgi:probable rRNA maturation factor
MYPVSITNTTKGRLPSLPFTKIKDKVLGKEYELSLVFCADKLSKRLNKTYRKKDYPTNVLSFSISKNSGEIFINLRRLKGFSVGYLFIHGLFHLKGLDHGYTMERAEEKVRKAFRIS